MTLRIIATGGTFDKHYDELTGQLVFSQSVLPAVLARARLTQDVVFEPLLALDSLEMQASHRQQIKQACSDSTEDRIVIVHGTDTLCDTAEMLGASKLANQPSTGLRLVPTTGSIVSLRFGTDIAIPEEFYSVSSIGQFNLTVNVSVANLTKDSWNNYELVVLVENPGVIIFDRGSSSTFVGLLTKDAVLQTKDSSDHVTLAYAKHMVGGGWHHSALNGLRWLHNHGITAAKNFVRDHINHPIANKAVEVASALGYGQTGGANKLQSRLM
jgi:L-asparaginase